MKKHISNNSMGGILIDKIVNDKSLVINTIKIGDAWYCAKPGQRNMSFIGKIKGCIRILRNKGLVTYFKEDE